MNYLIKILLFTIIFISKSYAQDEVNSKIIFKINDLVFTNIDLDQRIKYIEILNNIKLTDLNKKKKYEIINDYISSLIFFEYYKKNNIKYKNLNRELESFYNKRIKKHNSNIKNIKRNLKIDYIRKKIIEDILNSRKNLIDKNSNNDDLIYNYNINYLIVETKNISSNDYKDIRNRKDFNIFKNQLSNNKVSFLFKEEDIIDSSKLSKLLKKNIKNNIKFFNVNNNEYTTFFSIKKELESYEGIFVKLVNFKTNKKLNNDILNCNSITQKLPKTQFKEYEYSKLNNKIKDNLLSINDYIVIHNQDIYNYIFLCELRYDENKLMTINFDKQINNLVEEIQINFLKKYKKEYNFQNINE